MQVSDGEPAKWNLALNNARNLQSDLGAANVEIEIVAYGPGIGMLKRDSTVATRVDEALTSGVKIVACENTMRAQSSPSPTCCPRSPMSAPESSRSCSASSRDGAICVRNPGASLTIMSRRALLASVLLALPLGYADIAQAQEYPSRAVRVIVPFSPGGAVDGPMRLIAEGLSKRLGQTVFVENRPGAGATIGTEARRHGPRRTATRCCSPRRPTRSARPSTKHLSYDPVGDFEPISLIGREPGVIVVHPSLPVHTLQELIAYVKAHPGEVDYASSGNGAASICSRRCYAR